MWHHCCDLGVVRARVSDLTLRVFTQGNNEVPALGSNSLLDLCIVVAAIGQHQHLTPIVSANGVLQVEPVQGGHDALMFTVIGKTMRLTIRLAIEGNRPQGNQYVTQDQHDNGRRYDV
jgi:hypothetical protein